MFCLRSQQFINHIAGVGKGGYVYTCENKLAKGTLTQISEQHFMKLCHTIVCTLHAIKINYKKSNVSEIITVQFNASIHSPVLN